jgi:hypothetical protein
MLCEGCPVFVEPFVLVLTLCVSPITRCHPLLLQHLGDHQQPDTAAGEAARRGAQPVPAAWL